ncbi:hypothetical protein M9H77_11862 [Catharanthus roseus]|uniref:Uncharacterized protein n=1 Tax=Catharanthus roseus TaxID=4058 RepID=A0ACC0BFY1_CATRO|nr:hypothetical protein M9H77_11862 [Catharanthus roseus]
MDRFERKIFGWHRAKNIRIKSRISKSPDTTSPVASNWWDIRSGGRGVHLNPPPVAGLCWQATAEDSAAGASTDLHEEEEADGKTWANSALVRRGMPAAEASSNGACLAEEEDNIGSIRPSHNNGPSYSNGLNCFPNLTADQWS